MSGAESIRLGLQTTVIGLIIVFSVLIILAIVTWALNNALDPSQRKEKVEKKEAATGQTAPAPLANEGAGGVSPAVVAAITAAVVMATGKQPSEFKFTSIRRVPGRQSSWAMIGAAELMDARRKFRS